MKLIFNEPDIEEKNLKKGTSSLVGKPIKPVN
jgi:hypothetical protein